MIEGDRAVTFVPHRRRRRAGSGRVFLRVVLVLIVALVGGEIYARYSLGLGDPPLYIPDPKIEYLNKPGTYRRFGHSIHINQWSMRSPGFPEKKPDSNELRILVVGDSVVYGGAWMLDEDTATWKLAQRLSKAAGRPVVVANISAGSWGPPNELAYLERFGDFEADAIIVVWSSHDAWDVPTFAPLGVENPTTRPKSALSELIFRYAVPRYLRGAEPAPVHTVEQEDASLRAARSILEYARVRSIPIGVVLHSTRAELSEKAVEGLDALRGVAESEGTPVFLTTSVLAAPFEKGDKIYQDDIHPTPAGQTLLADLYFRIAAKLLSSPLEEEGK